ncbi:hypothetical protein SBRV1_gp44 [Sulfolobales Beppu rod-shaped virus 1]|uniref:Uncharacterized protein n=1 Tax=Sulfolobales Beppu rod-shaped virus 1 TaxID=2493121 RepID=A0A3S8NFA7_9VIRU|nr:hypothetical protein QIT32_gp44 [Sulfolobales Beppu rod-shaped virus 1]AZI75933.1 hypothetical protein SBRV1_gp44 [Sulfolobales Beppu rod-shaped virus 1]
MNKEKALILSQKYGFEINQLLNGEYCVIEEFDEIQIENNKIQFIKYMFSTNNIVYEFDLSEFEKIEIFQGLHETIIVKIT